MFDRVLIANRGEIAVRIARTLRELGVDSVAVYSDVDARSRHAASADEAIHLPGVAPAQTYMNVEALLDAAHSSGADAIHPGYGFLSENADFAAAVGDAGLVWIGPPPEATRAMGDKIRARSIARSAGVPVVPGLWHAIEDACEIVEFGHRHGYPLALKAAGGGGGRGLRIARSAADVEGAWASARREAQSYFGSDEVYVERYLESPKHLEVQLLAPRPDDALWLGVRDCSLQRRHQKIVEETPPARPAPLEEMGRAAVTLAKACGYVNAGTVEMLVDRAGDFYLLEVNARLQVEHTVTEEVLGLDLVACQLRIASGEPLGLTQSDIVEHGHAIECRINAEDPARGFAPTPGVIHRFTAPEGLGVRVDSGYSSGDEVPQAYDSLIAKVIAWGPTREGARRRMLRALDEMAVEGIATTISALRIVLGSDEFRSGTHSTTTLESDLRASLEELAPRATTADVLLVEGAEVRLWSPAMSASASAARAGGSLGYLVAPMQGTILEVLVGPGDEVEAGQPIVVLEAMKMETTLVAPIAGMIVALDAAAGATTAAGRVLARIG
ncbi:MAG: biotin carboxylase N-terminal domain-containing protein [Actinomycetota bacterium]